MREKFKSREKLDFNSTILCSFLTINLGVFYAQQYFMWVLCAGRRAFPA